MVRHTLTASEYTNIMVAFTSLNQQGIGGSVVEFSPATREARVRFPANVTLFQYSVVMKHKLSSYLPAHC